MQPEIEIGPLTLQTFGLMMGLGFVVAGFAASRFLKEIGKPADWAYEMVFAALVGGIVGARLWWVAENWSDAQDDVLGSLFSGAGLVWYGGALGGAGRRADLGLAAPLPDAADVRRRGRPAGDRLRDRPHRLPARRRRRLRRRLGRPVGDGLPGRDGPDHRGGASDPGLRDARDEPRRPAAVALAPPLAAGDAVRALPDPGRRRALPRRVRAPQRGRAARPHPTTGAVGRDDGRRRHVDLAGEPPGGVRGARPRRARR